MWWALLVLLAFVAGVISCFHAIMRTRTAQGAIAWSVSLLTFPWLAVPAYWVLGRRKFHGYRSSWKGVADQVTGPLDQARAEVEPRFIKEGGRIPSYEALRKLAQWPLSHGNDVDLLIDGEETFSSILAGIARARDYVLVCFYIVHADELGRRLRDALVERARAGVRVYFVYDELGSSGLPPSYVEDVCAAGGEMVPFGTTQGSNNRFQVNFRNHRKIVVVDGKEAWLGGLNVGDEYMGLNPKVGPWRDTHVRIEGPGALGAQAVFLLDWYWATRDLLQLSWTPVMSETGDKNTIVVATGPADDLETAKLFFMHAINSAQERIWIATPYFVPDPAVSSALQLAALRGVDIRIITPKNNDNFFVQMSSYYFIQELDGLGIRFFQYDEGFMHQKAMLIDHALSFVGTHNFDSRSFVLNFEVTAVVYDRDFASEMETMFGLDFARSEPLDPAALKKKPLLHRFAVRACRLMAPVQ